MELVTINKKDRKDLIYKSNSLVNSKYNITVVQARFIAFISSFINAYDTDFFTYKINTSIVLEFLKVKRTNIKWLSNTLKQLQSTLICLQNDEIAEEYTTFLSHFRLDKKNDVLEFSFHSSIKDCYIQLKNNFTKLKLENYIEFESIYTIRFYEWLEYNINIFNIYNNQKYSTIEIELDKLVEKFASSYNHKKKKFEIPTSYLTYNRFKTKVLEVAKKELKEKSDIYFEYEEIKVNRAVKILKIDILKNADRIKKDFKDEKKKALELSKGYKEIIKEQIKRIMARAKNIKDPLKYEQKLSQKSRTGDLKFDKDLQEIINKFDKETFKNL
ncbi:hypothetical protein CJ672_07690 [Arcobacter cryaerophilus gv. occultus]|uniref:replication initiation protein n=1 Tax=Aliarcobacter cryaerophilus TaxID=28198 RepID=UPI000D01A52E|nr:replication initiation protein [Aliarcobacter cryaerophilus]MBP6714320.1 replication initiation protein [Aliarcobacter sp.]PRM91849.1 hypothetical protein CJ672_07690 [Arcobacter cryaerophilus gv. occultus]